MKAKYFIIALLVSLLGIIVYEMMRYESKSRAEHVIKIKVNDDSKPLIEEIPHDKLYQYALKSEYSTMTEGDYFKVATTKMKGEKKIIDWEKLFLKGVNLGVAMPGKYATEFSLNFNEYMNWFRLIGNMNANVIRIYTILPPEFYEAFSYYNLHCGDKKLYLLQGVWMEEPEASNYYHPRSQREFQKEIINVLDVIHGNAVIEPKAGHASGTYASNISTDVIGIILGREWEPQAVSNTNRMNTVTNYTGNFVSVNNATPMEAWLAQMLDFTVLYETQTYQAQRPVSFVNWLTLDPLYHSTEFIESKKIKEYDNDKESIDLRKFNTTELFAPGIFASYHVYPYYPDFIFLQKEYAESINRDGKKDNFIGYLRDLKKCHPGIPLVIAEYGLPSSRGNSHYTPFGFNQGGLSEEQQADRSSILTYDIADTHCAGAVFFEWIDEWFKFNWLVMDFEQPMERRMYWHNMENPEKNFGIMAVESRNKVVDGKLDDWKNIPAGNKAPFVECDADASYLYIVAHLPGFNFKKNNFYIALDTYDKEKGDHKLPFLEKEIDNGIEFLLEFKDTGNAKILVDGDYSVYTDIYNGQIPVYASKKNNSGKFVEEFLLTNRSRITLTGDTIKSVTHNRSKLVYGNNSQPMYSNSDWFWDDSAENLEIRLTWHLINVSDPSRRYVLDDKKGTPDIEYSQTPGITLLSYRTDKKNQVQDNYEKFYSWEPWEEPSYQTRLKPIYYTLQKCFQEITVAGNEKKPDAAEKFTICPFYENKTGAVSIAFSGNEGAQYQQALPALDKYLLKGSFGMAVAEQNSAKEQPEESSVERINPEEVVKLVSKGHEVELQMDGAGLAGLSTEKINQHLKSSALLLSQAAGTKILTVQYISSVVKPMWIETALKAGFPFVQTEQDKNSKNNSSNPRSIVVAGNDPFSCKRLDSTLQRVQGHWTIFNYPHILEDQEYPQAKRLKKKDMNGVPYELLERHIRLFRNSTYWIAPVSTIGKYIKEKEGSSLSVAEHNNLVLLNIRSKLDSTYNQPLTVEYCTQHRKIKITNSAADGVYEAREGKIYFNVYPKREVIIEILER